MSLDVTLKDPTSTYECGCLYDANITHNLGEMATKAGIYEAIWRPYRLVDGYKKFDNYDDECSFEESIEIRAKDISDIIQKGLIDLKKRPDYFRQFNSPNGWGLYEHFVPFVEEYLDALYAYPESIVEISR